MTDQYNRPVVPDEVPHGGAEIRDEQRNNENREAGYWDRQFGFRCVAREGTILLGVYSALLLLFYLALLADNLVAVGVLFLIWLPLLLVGAMFLAFVTFYWGFLGSTATALAFWFLAIPCYLLTVSSVQGQFEGGIAILGVMGAACGGSVVLGLVSGVVLATLHDVD